VQAQRYGDQQVIKPAAVATLDDLRGWGMTEQTAYARHAEEHASTMSVVDAFEHQAEANPNRAAIRRASQSVTGEVSYGQLNAWADAIASELLSRRGSKPEPVPLAVCSPEMMLASALGVLKAGKFYVAVNPLHPAPYVERLLEELDASLLLCDGPGEVVARRTVPSLSVQETLACRSPVGRPGLRFDERRLAYVLYTSGSTGRPRGVAQSRRDMLHNVARHRPLKIGQDDCVTLISADGFVASVSNPYIALLGGAALAPYSFRDSGVDGVLRWLEAVDVTVLYAFPSFLRQLAAADKTGAYDALRLAYLGGETVLPTDLANARRLFPRATLSVGLNSSETGLTCLHVVLPDSPLPTLVPAGRPVMDVQIAVVGEDGALLGAGGCGEIVVRSDYVRPAYWRRGGIPRGPSMLAFHTGDRGRIAADGVVYHLGRVDQMLKIRGFRVETIEVEAVIAALPGVADVAVVGIGEPSAKELTACVVADEAGIDPETVRSAVGRHLPVAMVPTRVQIVDELPRTPNGKVDRKRLATLTSRAGLEGTREIQSACCASAVDQSRRDAVQRRILEIWAAELGVEQVSAERDLFALGGTSLTAVSLVSRLRREFGLAIPLAALFRSPTVSALTDVVMELRERQKDEHVHVHELRPIVAVRLVRESDIPDICALVNHYIEHTSFNFRTERQTPEEWTAEWSAGRERYPWLVAGIDGATKGVAYAGPWKGRAAYDWCAEVTVYVAHTALRVGVGEALYRRLLAMLDGQGYRSELAVITLPNASSVALHERAGFRHAGTLGELGYKNGRWLDVGLWQRLGPLPEEPPVTPRGGLGE
jgi:acyl-coenzyme A synthetase/AMP-(fatty) acid ligase/L-amino acid N-acyltransferase YncA/acyl carrier protein